MSKNALLALIKTTHPCPPVHFHLPIIISFLFLYWCISGVLGTRLPGLGGSSRQRTIGIVSCFLAPGELIITGQGSNLFVFGSDSKRLSAGFHISSDHTACRTSLLPTIISPHSLSTEGWGLSHERCGGGPQEWSSLGGVMSGCKVDLR